MLFVLPLFSHHLNTRWKGFFAWMVLLSAAPLMLGCLAMMGLRALAGHSSIAAGLSFATDPVAAGSLLTTCLLDRRAGQRRDWLHWCGVLVFLWVMFLRVAVLPRT